MKFEFSAGGVVYKREDGQIFALLCQHSKNHNWGFPKGHIGDTTEGETTEEAAVREVKEETGIDARILVELTPIEYWYKMDNEKRKKKVVYYLMEHLGGDMEDHDHEMEAVEWLKDADVLKRLAYPGERKVWREARKLIVEKQ